MARAASPRPVGGKPRFDIPSPELRVAGLAPQHLTGAVCCFARCGGC